MGKKKRKRDKNKYYYSNAIRVANKKKRLFKMIKELKRKKEKFDSQNKENSIQKEIDRLMGITEKL